MILGTLTDFLAAVDGFVGFGFGVFVGWWIWRHRPPNRKYTVDLTIHKEDDAQTQHGVQDSD